MSQNTLKRTLAGALTGAFLTTAASAEAEFPTQTDIDTLNAQYISMGYDAPNPANIGNIAKNESFRHISVSCSAHQNTGWSGKFFTRETPENTGDVVRSNDFNLSHEYSTAALVYKDSSGVQRTILSTGETYEITQGLWTSGTGDMKNIEQRLVGYGFTELDVDNGFDCNVLRRHIVPENQPLQELQLSSLVQG